MVVYVCVCVCVCVNACICGSVSCSTISTHGYLGLKFSELQNKSCMAPGSIQAAVYHLPYLHTENGPQAGIRNRAPACVIFITEWEILKPCDIIPLMRPTRGDHIEVQLCQWVKSKGGGGCGAGLDWMSPLLPRLVIFYLRGR